MLRVIGVVTVGRGDIDKSRGGGDAQVMVEIRRVGILNGVMEGMLLPGYFPKDKGDRRRATGVVQLVIVVGAVLGDGRVGTACGCCGRMMTRSHTSTLLLYPRSPKTAERSLPILLRECCLYNRGARLLTEPELKQSMELRCAYRYR